MRLGRPAIVGKLGIKNLMERLRRYDVSHARAEAIYAGISVFSEQVVAAHSNVASI